MSEMGLLNEFDMKNRPPRRHVGQIDDQRFGLIGGIETRALAERGLQPFRGCRDFIAGPQRHPEGTGDTEPRTGHGKNLNGSLRQTVGSSS